MKICSKCKVEKNESEFSIRQDGRLHYYCKQCNVQSAMESKLRKIKEKDEMALSNYYDSTAIDQNKNRKRRRSKREKEPEFIF